MNFIHPFTEGNGRTARAASYLVLCLKLGGWLPGQTILPDRIGSNRNEYVAAIRAAHEADFCPLHGLLCRLLKEQLAG